MKESWVLPIESHTHHTHIGCAANGTFQGFYVYTVDSMLPKSILLVV